MSNYVKAREHVRPVGIIVYVTYAEPYPEPAMGVGKFSVAVDEPIAPLASLTGQHNVLQVKGQERLMVSSTKTLQVPGLHALRVVGKGSNKEVVSFPSDTDRLFSCVNDIMDKLKEEGATPLSANNCLENSSLIFLYSFMARSSQQQFLGWAKARPNLDPPSAGSMSGFLSQKHGSEKAKKPRLLIRTYLADNHATIVRFYQISLQNSKGERNAASNASLAVPEPHAASEVAGVVEQSISAPYSLTYPLKHPLFPPTANHQSPYKAPLLRKDALPEVMEKAPSAPSAALIGDRDDDELFGLMKKFVQLSLKKDSLSVQMRALKTERDRVKEELQEMQARLRSSKQFKMMQ